MSDDEEECEECEHTQDAQKKKKKHLGMNEMLSKFGKEVKFGKEFPTKFSKELQEFLDFSRLSVDKTYVTSKQDLAEASEGMEKAFEIILKTVSSKKIDPKSFTLGVVFGLSRWSFLDSEILKKMTEEKMKKIPYAV
jgi:hypothetical protein